MKEKSAYEAFFDNTQNIQCITCLDAYVLESYICDSRVRVERLYDDKFKVSIIAYDENGNRISPKRFDKTCLKGQTLIQNKPSVSEGYFSASLEKVLFCGFSWILSLLMFCTGFSNFHRIMNFQTTG